MRSAESSSVTSRASHRLGPKKYTILYNAGESAVESVVFNFSKEKVAEAPRENLKSHEGPASPARLSPEQKLALKDTVNRLRATSQSSFRLVALDATNGTIIIQEGPSLLKTVSIGTGETLGEAYMSVDINSMIDRPGPTSVPSLDTNAVAEAENPTGRIEVKTVEHDRPASSQFAAASANSIDPHSEPILAVKAAAGESMMDLIRSGAYTTQVPPEESELTRLSRMSPSERKMNDAKLLRELRYS